MKYPKICIVILNYMTYELTINCLKQIKNIKYKDLSVVVVDNNSPNDSYQKLDQFISNENFDFDILLIPSKKNGGYSYGNNLGSKKGYELGAELILIMNNDIEIKSEDFLTQLVNEAMKANASLVGPTIIQDGREQLPLFLTRITPIRYILKNIFFPVSIIFSKLKRNFYYKTNTLSQVYGVSGCCFLVDSNIFKEVEYLDDELFLYGEELILSEKLYLKNYKVFHSKTVKVIHNHSKTIGAFYKLKKVAEMQQDSHRYYIEQYRKDINKINKKLMLLSDQFRVGVYMALLFRLKKIKEIVKKN